MHEAPNAPRPDGRPVKQRVLDVARRGSFLAAQSLGVLHLTLGHPEESAHWFEKANELRMSAPYAAKPRLLG